MQIVLTYVAFVSAYVDRVHYYSFYQKPLSLHVFVYSNNFAIVSEGG